jgi:DNA-directed RNA polymerase alpha subunit
MIRSTSVKNIGLGKRASNALINAAIVTVEDLLERSALDVFLIPGVGYKGCEHIVAVLQKHGLKLASNNIRRLKIKIEREEKYLEYLKDKLAEEIANDSNQG